MLVVVMAVVVVATRASEVDKTMQPFWLQVSSRMLVLLYCILVLLYCTLEPSMEAHARRGGVNQRLKRLREGHCESSGLAEFLALSSAWVTSLHKRFRG